MWDFPGGPVVKNLSFNAGDVGLIPGWGTKIPNALGQLSLCATFREQPSHHIEDRVLQLRPDAAKQINILL